MASTPVAHFTVGKLYSNETIYRSLSIGNAGGIRPSIAKDGGIRRLVIFTSSVTAKILSENPYSDKMEGDVLVYTAAGREGTQTLSGVNARIQRQDESSFPIYCFRNIANRRDKSAGRDRWEFLGLFRYQRHFREVQFDSKGLPRNVWVFELKRIPRIDRITLDSDTQDYQNAKALLSRDDFFDNTPLVDSPLVTAREDTSHELEIARQRMLCLHPAGFEQLVKSALELSGFENVKVTRYSQDGGIDVEANLGRSLWPMRGALLQVQAKRWIHTVGRREVAELRGSLTAHARGAVITTSHFSKSALAEASNAAKSPIIFVNGYEFAEITKQLRLEI